MGRKKQPAPMTRAERLKCAIRSLGISDRTRWWLTSFGYDAEPTLERVLRCARAAAIDAFFMKPGAAAEALRTLNASQGIKTIERI